MVNQQLIDFIKQSLQQGLDKEKITGDLLANGWTKEDVEECLDTLNINIPQTSNPSPVISVLPLNSNNLSFFEKENHLGKKIFPIIIILILLAGVASGYYFRDYLLNIPIVKYFISDNNTQIIELTQDQILQAEIEKAKLEELNNQDQKEIPAVVETNTEDFSLPVEVNQ